MGSSRSQPSMQRLTPQPSGSRATSSAARELPSEHEIDSLLRPGAVMQTLLNPPRLEEGEATWELALVDTARRPLDSASVQMSPNTVLLHVYNLNEQFVR